MGHGVRARADNSAPSARASERSNEILVVGPLGSQPWAPVGDAIEALRKVAPTALFQPHLGISGVVPALPNTYTPGRMGTFLPVYVIHRAVTSAAWLAVARRHLRRHDVHRIVVWDEVAALILALAGWRIAKVTWVKGEGVSTIRSRLARAGLLFFVHEVVVQPHTRLRALNHKAIVANPFDGIVDTEPAKPFSGWGVFVGTQRISTGTVENIARRAETSEAQFISSLASEGVEVRETLDRVREVLPRTPVRFDTPSSWLRSGVPAEALAAGVLPSDPRVRVARSFGIKVSGVDGLPDATPSAEQWWTSVLLPQDKHEIIRRYAKAIARCPACGSSRRSPISRTPATRILRCRNCSLLYADRVLPTSTVHTDGYHEGTAAFGVNYVANDAMRACADVAETRLELLAPFIPDGGEILDVGAGVGHFVARAREWGFRAEGVEPVQRAADLAHDLFDIKLFVSDVEHFETERKYHAVVLGQTLEHLADPVAMLIRIREKFLLENGYLLIEVPNAASAARWLAGPRWMHWQPGDHVSYFTDATLRAAAKSAGYSVICSRTTSFAFPWLDVSVLGHNLGLTARPLRLALALVALSPFRGLLSRRVRKLSKLLDNRRVGQDLQMLLKPR